MKFIFDPGGVEGLMCQIPLFASKLLKEIP